MHDRDTVGLALLALEEGMTLAGAAEVAAHASAIGVDAVIVQDLGVMRMLRQTVPDLPIHASTQLTIHSLDGVKRCADLGASRVILARELSLEESAPSGTRPRRTWRSRPSSTAPCASATRGGACSPTI